MPSPDASNPVLAAIALGSNLSSNLGNSLETVEAAIKSLASHPDLTLVAVSHWYQTVAIGPPQPNYVNGCALVRMRSQSAQSSSIPNLSPQALLDLLIATEQQFGRMRTQHWGPRTLDLDLLLYDSVVLHTPTLTLPHPHMAQRAFVLIPLADILPNWVHPMMGLTIQQLCNQVDCTGVSQLQAG
jgi:2-amino-4-hydroxy-6-hydroxymethyldihydropteridine diphosphokinase